MEQEDMGTPNNVRGVYSDNRMFNDYNMLQIRLDAEQLLKPIELYLKGEREVYSTETESMIIIQETAPKANQLGINSIMSWLRSILTPQIVQGNIEDWKEYHQIVADLRLDLFQDIINNCIDWEMKDQELTGICDMIITSIKLFLSRLVKNKERESYANTMVTTERSDYVKQNGFKLPFT